MENEYNELGTDDYEFLYSILTSNGTSKSKVEKALDYIYNEYNELGGDDYNFLTNILDESKAIKETYKSKNKKTESLGDRYEVWQSYYEDGRTTTEYVMSFDNYAEAQRFASGLMQDPDCDAWVEDKEEEESKKVEDRKIEAKQVNNMEIKYNKIYDKYDVITPDGRALEEFDTEEEAIEWAKEQKDFINNGNKIIESKLIVTNIKWDTDGEDIDLPKEMEVELPEYIDETDEDEVDEYVSDYISDETGFCHYGFDIKEVKTEAVMTSNKVSVYQIQETANCSYLFMGYDFAVENGGPDMNDYEKVAEVEIDTRDTDVTYVLDEVFTYGNTNIEYYDNNPKARSISVSDILEYNGNKYYVDSFGFKKLEDTESKKVESEEKVDYSKFTPTNKVLSGDKGLSEDKIDEMRWALPDLFKDMTDEQKQIFEELSLREMVMSCLVYGSDIHTKENNVSLGKYRGKPYVAEYYDTLGKDVTEEIIKQQTDYFNRGKVIKDVGTDSEGVTYNSFEEPEEESKKVTEAKYGDSNPDKIVPDAYCEIEKTDKGYYINCGIGDHTNLGSGNFTIYPEDYLANLHKEVKKLAKERGIKRVYDKVKTIIPEYNAMIPEYNANIENMIKDLTPFAEKSKQGQLTRADLDSIEEITGKITPNRMSTLPEFEWSGKFGKLRSLLGNLKRYETDLSNPLASADTITITESKEVKTEASLNKFQTLTLDKNGNEMLLKDTSYNHACSWLEKELAKTGSKVVDTETKGNKTIIKADNKTKFEYDEEKGTLKRLEEAEDMTQVKDAIETAVEKSDSTDLEKEQVKGSLDVLKTDEESAIEGYEDFKSETEKVADEELADAVNNQMEEIIDDEKEHIEKLDTIKSALGENKKTEAEVKRNNSKKRLDYKLDGFKGVTIIVVDKKNNIDTEDYMKFDNMEFGIDEYEFEDSMIDGIKDILTDIYEYTDDYYDDRFTTDEIIEMAEDITQDVLQLYDDLPDELIDFENGIANLDESKSITEETNTFGIAEDMYNRTHKDKWHTLSDDEKASYYNRNYKRIKKQADNLDKEEENKKITEAFWDDGKLYNYKGIDIQQSISDRGEKLYSILNNQEPFSIPDFSTLSAAKKYIDDNNLKNYKEKQESKKTEAKDLYGEWIDLLDKIPANRLEDYKIEYDLYDEQLNGDEKPTEMILPKLIAGAKKYIKSEKVESIDPEAVKEKVEKAKADIGLKKAEEMIDTEKELTEGIKKEIIQYAKQQGLDVEKLQKQGQLDSVAEALDNIIGEMVSKTAVEYMDTTGKDIEWDFDISNNDIQVIIQ